MSETPAETVHGLDPRALLARAMLSHDTGALLRAWMPPEVEELHGLFPQLVVEAIIGRGGMGAVYRARQPELERTVALKLLPPEAAADPLFAERFRTEARALARLQHPRIVTIHDSGQTAAGHLFFVMEFVDGSDLGALLASGPLPAERALEIAAAVCEALEFAHGRGIVHRDIKPGNVLIAADGAVKVADFGLARLVARPDAGLSRLTGSGVAVGTLDYMAPEQRSGAEPTPAADLFALGVVLYEMLTGRLPLGAWEPPSRKGRGGARLDALVHRALQPEPARRFRDAGEMRRALAEISRGNLAPNRRWLLAAAGGALLISLGGMAWMNWPHTDVRKVQAAIVSSTPALAPQSVPLLQGLDLREAIVARDWRWLEAPGGTLSLPPITGAPAARLRLPAKPGAGSYNLAFRLLLADSGASSGAVLQVGSARVALILDLYSTSGLSSVRRQRWDANPTTVREALPVGRPLRVEVSVHPEGERATIIARVDDAPFLRWEGLQRDLTLDEAEPHSLSLKDQHALGLASYTGGIEISDVQFTLRE